MIGFVISNSEFYIIIIVGFHVRKSNVNFLS